MKAAERVINTLYKIDDIRNIFACSKGKAYDIIHLPGFPKVQIGRVYYVVPDELDKWLKANKGKSYL
jgi:hypothetical protein